MIKEQVAEFPISPELVMLNHASFGVMTSEIMRLAEQTRAELEADSLALVDVEALVPRLQRAAGRAATQLGLVTGSFALTQNATAGAAAIMRSLRVPAGSRVVVCSTEYQSIYRGWQVRCEEVGAQFVPFVVPVPLASTEQLLAALDEQLGDGPVQVAHLSLVASSTAIALPVETLVSWFRERGAIVVVDAAHGPGHVTLPPDAWGASAMHGTMHKWFPTPRPVGFIWLVEDLCDLVRPAEVSLTWDAADLVERFSWQGTYDPTPRLCVERAMEQWEAWRRDGDLDRCAQLAQYASLRLEEVGGVPTSAPAFRPPRLRAVTLAGSRDRLRASLDAAGVRAFTGTGPGGETMLRVATHVYNDEADVDLLCELVGALR